MFLTTENENKSELFLLMAFSLNLATFAYIQSNFRLHVLDINGKTLDHFEVGNPLFSMSWLEFFHKLVGVQSQSQATGKSCEG